MYAVNLTGSKYRNSAAHQVVYIFKNVQMVNGDLYFFRVFIFSSLSQLYKWKIESHFRSDFFIVVEAQ